MPRGAGGSSLTTQRPACHLWWDRKSARQRGMAGRPQRKSLLGRFRRGLDVGCGGTDGDYAKLAVKQQPGRKRGFAGIGSLQRSERPAPALLKLKERTPCPSPEFLPK